MDADRAIAVLQKASVYDLVCFDGCLCGNFALQGIEVNIWCRKSTGSQGVPVGFGMLRVHSRHLDATRADLRRVADEVIRQLSDNEPRFVVRLCDYEHDQKGRCCYCSKPRDNPEDYLCKACEARGDVEF